MSITDLADRLHRASADLRTMSSQLDSPKQTVPPHIAGDLVSAMDSAWAAQQALTAELAAELRDLAENVRVAARRYLSADQAH